MNKKIVWTIGGTDSSGGAGVQCDLKTLDSFGVHGCSIITAITAQNNQMVNNIDYISGDSLQAQINSLDKCFPPLAIKIGMLGNLSSIQTVANYLANYNGNVILDPITFSSSGSPLFCGHIEKYLFQLKIIFPLVDILTPNLLEAQQILRKNLQTFEDIERAAHELIALGVKSILIKGGHFNHSLFCHDFWTDGKESMWLSSPRYQTKNYRGSGCVLSAAIAACLGLGYGIKDSLVIAKMYINRGIRLADILQDNSGFIFHGGWPEDEIDLPYLTKQAVTSLPNSFKPCTEKIGLYPIVDGIDWLKKLLPTGIKTIQLRIKDKSYKQLNYEIKESINLANKYQVKLYINDYWHLAILYHAYGVHLGQTDLNDADIAEIHAKGLHLGISTHCYYEVARAHAYRPSYIACGPIFTTNSKVMSFQPQGTLQLARWKRSLNYPIVAIGGISEKNILEVIAAEVDGVAMISAITNASNPANVTKNLLEIINKQLLIKKIHA